MISLLSSTIKMVLRSMRFWMAILLCVLSAEINCWFNVIQGNVEIGAINTFLFSILFGLNVLSFSFPLISAIIGGFIYYDSLSGGYIKNEILHNKRYFLISKMTASFICGFLVFAISFIIIGIISFIIDPSESGRVLPVDAIQSFYDVYASSLIKYAILSAILLSVIGGIYSVFAMGIYAITQNIYLSILFPPMFYIISTVLVGSFGGEVLNTILPYSTWTFFYLNNTQLSIEIAEALLLSIILATVGYKKTLSNI